MGTSDLNTRLTRRLTQGPEATSTGGLVIPASSVALLINAAASVTLTPGRPESLLIITGHLMAALVMSSILMQRARYGRGLPTGAALLLMGWIAGALMATWAPLLITGHLSTPAQTLGILGVSALISLTGALLRIQGRLMVGGLALGLSLMILGIVASLMRIASLVGA